MPLFTSSAKAKGLHALSQSLDGANHPTAAVSAFEDFKKASDAASITSQPPPYGKSYGYLGLHTADSVQVRSLRASKI